jgi:2,5-diamino-6-(ribosylamino)-4(3H)-pyrimidinone 5'-phosphate reductase
MAEPVNGGGVDPIDPQIEGAPDRLDGLMVILGAPTERPATASHGPGAQANGGQSQVGPAKLFCFHVVPEWNLPGANLRRGDPKRQERFRERPELSDRSETLPDKPGCMYVSAMGLKAAAVKVKADHGNEKLPFVYINVASTVDGKLAPATRRFVPFSSKRDRELLMELRTSADAVMAGARTVDLGPVDLGPGGEKFRRMRLKQGLTEYNLRVVVSGSGSLDPEAKIFQHRFSPIIVLTSGRATLAHLRRLRQVADDVEVFGEDELDFRAAFGWLREKWGVKRLLCEGGGELNAALFEQGLVDELYLTLSPVIFGGRHAPTLADGEGIGDKSAATRLKLKSLKKAGDELFLVYRVQHGRNSSETRPR